MDFINRSNNTMLLADIGKSIPFLGEKEQEISLDEVKRSSAFRKLLIAGAFHITRCGDSVFEQNLLNMQSEINYMNIKENEVTKESNGMEIKIRGHMLEAGGYAKVNRNLALGLSELGVYVEASPISNKINNLTNDEIKNLSKLMNNKVGRGCITIDSIIPSFGNICSGKYKILYTTIESSSIPKQFLEMASCYNEVWVTSDFCKDVLINNGYTRPIFVLPDSINTGLYTKECEPYNFSPQLKNFVFLSIFGWSYRKGYDALLKSYLQEFSEKDDVSLLIISRNMAGINNDNIKEEIEKYIKKYGGDNPAHIARCSNVIPENLFPSIYRACDAYILMTRGEGFNLSVCEASLCDIPVICTNYSGHTMFLNKDNSYLVDIDKLSEVQPGTMNVHYWDNQLFPELKSEKFIQDTRDKMRDVYENYDKAIKRNIKLKKFILDNYDYKNIASLAKERLDQIWSEIC